jgi:hypothetical protein
MDIPHQLEAARLRAVLIIARNYIRQQRQLVGYVVNAEQYHDTLALIDQTLRLTET